MGYNILASYHKELTIQNQLGQTNMMHTVREIWFTREILHAALKKIEFKHLPI